MPDPLNTYRARLLQNTSYIPGPAFVDKLRWDNEDSGHVLVDGNTNSHLVAIVVGRVSENKLNCGPAGNYLGSDAEFANLATAKFQLLLGKPFKTPFETDFDKALNNLTDLQSKVAATQDLRHFIVSDGGNQNLRFGRKIFEKRVS
jgi:hypothetical protein